MLLSYNKPGPGRVIDSQNHWDWKRPLRSSSPTIKPSPLCPLRIAEVGKDLLDHQVQSYHRITGQEVRKWKLGKEFSFVMWEWLCLSLFIKSFEILNVKNFTVLKMQFSNTQCLFNLNSISLQVLMKFPPFILCFPVLETCCFSPIHGTKKYHGGL